MVNNDVGGKNCKVFFEDCSLEGVNDPKIDVGGGVIFVGLL